MKKMQGGSNQGFMILVVVLVIASIVGIWYAAQNSDKKTVDNSNVMEVVEDDWTKGNPDAKVVLVEYLDFECGACKAYYPLIGRLTKEYGDRILLVSRYFPLPGHKNAMTSAIAVEAAAQQGKYWEMHDMLFENQDTWSAERSANPEVFVSYAEKLGLDIAQYKKDASSEEVENRVLRDKDSGVKAGVNGTPSYFLNGKKIQNPRGYDEFKALIDAELESVKQ